MGCSLVDHVLNGVLFTLSQFHFHSDVTTGLRRYTRHPSYFGDALQWWGLGLLGLAAGAWWSLLGPLAMTLVLLRVTGVAVMDAHPEIGMVCGAARYWRSWNGGNDTVVHSGHVSNRVVHPPDAALALYPLGRAASPCPSDLLVRRDLVMALGGFEEHFTGVRQLYEDQGFLAKLYLAAPVYFSDRVWIR